MMEKKHKNASLGFTNSQLVIDSVQVTESIIFAEKAIIVQTEDFI